MANTKNAQLRYRVLDKCFKNKYRQYTFQDLLEEIDAAYENLYGSSYTSVSERTLREDIRSMRKTFDARIDARQSEDGKYYYTYADPKFSIFKTELSERDLDKLESTIEMLGRYRGLPSTAWLEEVISSLQYRFDLKASRQTLVSFEQNTELKGLEHLSSLIDATMNRQALDIIYHSYRGNEKTYAISPYYMKQYNGRWFLFGLDNTMQRLMNMALDRIIGFKPSAEPFVPNTDIDFDTYFNDIIGVTVPDADVKKETITLRFTDARYPYVVSKPIHHSQQIVDPKSHTLSISVRPNRELFTQLLSFIPDVEVIAPEWLRKDIADKLKTALEKHV